MKMCPLFRKKKDFSLPFVAFFQALGLLFYCSLVGLLFWRGEKLFGPISYYWGPLFFLVLFIVSALICALIAFGYAFILFWERKQTMEAFKLIIFMTAWLALFTFLIVLILLIS
ncbi:MAG TPA: hypothetical protein VMY36_02480 [Patescibacteria group bacterium]|nr:hypothetical protein [Patescibacteria group bacterium]